MKLLAVFGDEGRPVFVRLGDIGVEVGVEFFRMALFKLRYNLPLRIFQVLMSTGNSAPSDMPKAQ